MLLPLLIEIKPQSLDSGMSSIIRKVQNELEVNRNLPSLPLSGFLVRRQGTKIRLCGRDPMGEVTVPDVLPIATRSHFGSALVACNAGQTLAGIFFQRVFIEQFWRSLPAIETTLAADPRLTGDKMGELYNATLPNDFKERFPSLSAIYSDLSAAIHSADANADLFEKSAAQTIEHFEARRLFKIADEREKA